MNFLTLRDDQVPSAMPVFWVCLARRRPKKRYFPFTFNVIIIDGFSVGDRFCADFAENSSLCRRR
jgi:hypothetical protein